MKYPQFFTLLLFVLVPNVFLESCDSQKSVSQQISVEQAATMQSKPSSIPLKVQASFASYKTYNESAELEIAADLVVVGRAKTSIEDGQPTAVPESEKAKRNHAVNESVVIKDEQGFIVDRYTITSVKVHKVVKGKVEDKEIKVLQPAAVVKESNQPAFISTIEDYAPLKKNVKYLLFLKEVDTATYPNLAGVYSILSVNQGKFNLDKGDDEETRVEGRNEQYQKLKVKIRKNYESMVNAIP
jgi:hypothetical protein